MCIKEVFDTAVSGVRFGINTCIEIENAVPTESAKLLSSIRNKLTASEYKAFMRSIIRNSFLIELVNDEITSTKVETHWSDHLADDIRYSTFDMCYSIFFKLLNTLNDLNDDDLSILKEFFNNTVVPYEMPIDYINRFANPIHTLDNVALYLDEDVKKCIEMRKFIRNQSENPSADVFQTILEDKIKTKTYLTDRALTGIYRTNREKRWEAHPNSVQYALRRECMKIENKLLLQVATFEGCNCKLVSNLQRKALLPTHFDFCKCPVTGDTIQFDKFEHDTLHPTHGKSLFQVGHLNPLKAQNVEGMGNGHIADNVCWISENGNRIQGSLAMHEVDDLLRRIFINRPELRQ